MLRVLPGRSTRLLRLLAPSGVGQLRPQVQPLLQRRNIFLAASVVLDEAAAPEEVVNSAVSGRRVEPLSLAVAADGYRQLLVAADAAAPVSDFRSWVARVDAVSLRSQLVLVRRDFWVYDDYTNAETFRMGGPAALLFDGYKWCTELHGAFKEYVERFFPERDHTHLLYAEYVRLLHHFRYSLLGKNFPSVLPPWMKLRPHYGVPIPPRAMLPPHELYAAWLAKFTKPLGINEALVCRAGCGIAAFATRMRVAMVAATDPSPRAVASLVEDRARYRSRLNRLHLSVSDLAPSQGGKFDLVTLPLGAPALDPDSGVVDSTFAPGFAGLRGELEHFFENVSDLLKPGGVVAVLFSNIHELAEPGQPHPIEHELRANRRFVLLDYHSAKMKSIVVNDAATVARASADDIAGGRRAPLELRAELWVLHRLEDLPHFAWVHGVPGARAPDHVAQRWASKTFQQKQARLIRQRVEDQGGNWNDYQSRLLQFMQSSPEDEDAVAQAVRARLDPTYAESVAQRTKKIIEARLAAERASLERLKQQSASPRDAYDRAYTPATATSTAGAGGRTHSAPAAAGLAPPLPTTGGQLPRRRGKKKRGTRPDQVSS